MIFPIARSSTKTFYVLPSQLRHFSVSSQIRFKVAVVGARGGVGKTLCTLLKINRLVTELTLYDSKQTLGMAMDLSHIETPAKVIGYCPGKLAECIRCANIVCIAAGCHRRGGATRDSLFDKNACIIKSIMQCVAEAAPLAMIAIITNPINSIVPVACEIMRKACKLDPKRVFGVTTMDVVRANTFVAEQAAICPLQVNVPVIGAHSTKSIIPLFSRTCPSVCLNDCLIKTLTCKVQQAGSEVLKAKDGKTTATLGMAYATSRFINSLLRALAGEKNVIECAYVMSNVTEAAYFSTPLLLGKCGITKNYGLGKLSDYEICLMDKAIPDIIIAINRGIQFVNC